MTLLEQSADAIRLGSVIFAESSLGSLQSASWRQWRLISAAGPGPAGADEPAADRPAADRPAAGKPAAGKPAADQPAADLPAADLATAAYVLGELTSAQQAALVSLAARCASAVLLVEPGTPAGHRRILAARAQLLAAGYRIAAPCPHQLGCPLDVAGDWCHFGARLPRSALHRQVKGTELSYEDEKFSYVAAVRPDVGLPELPGSRVVRRPQQRKGLVTLDLCARDGQSRPELVSKSKGEAYRRARKTSWGDRWG
jgi:ribosomal protein RSM22 (predicted rRNA methylase)